MPRILIIEDQSEVRSWMRDALELNGHTVIEAEDGLAGVELFRSTAVDLIITDILMPRQEGLRTIVELKREVPDIKIIAMSGAGEVARDNFLSVASRLGAVATLSKPFGVDELFSAVDTALHTTGGAQDRTANGQDRRDSLSGATGLA